MAHQLMLFEAEVDRRGDGAFVIRPRAIAAGEWITARAACKLLRCSDKRLRMLIRAEVVRAWKHPGAANCHLHVDRQSCLEYLAARFGKAC